MLYALCILFQAHVIPGSGIARKQNIPTLNLSLDDVPSDLQEGIYACRVSFEQTSKPANLPVRQAGQQTSSPAVMHYGPRPAHNLGPSCEVHVLDQSVSDPPASVDVMIVERIRAIQSFEHIDALKSAIQNDIAQARAILSA